MKFTTAGVAALKRPADKDDHVEWDDALPGFGVRLRGNSKTYLIQYRVGLQQRRESIGDVRKMKLDAARDIARKRFAQAKLGTDPAVEKAKARAATLILGDVVDRYLSVKEAELRRSTFTAASRYFRVHWAPLLRRPLESIRRPDIAALLHDLAKARGRVAAARAKSNLSALYTWAMKEGLAEFNPCLGTNDPAAGIKPRERILSDAEIKTLWAACGDNSFGRIVKLLLLTATYDRYHYGAEIRAALDKWAEHVTAIVEGRTSKIVSLRA